MSAHTPGPWKVSFESVDPEWAVVTAQGGRVVANVNSESGPDAISAPAMVQMPRDANARLIAAAPDLLQVLKDAQEVLSVALAWENSSNIRREIKRVIALAEDIRP